MTNVDTRVPNKFPWLNLLTKEQINALEEDYPGIKRDWDSALDAFDVEASYSMLNREVTHNGRPADLHIAVDVKTFFSSLFNADRRRLYGIWFKGGHFPRDPQFLLNALQALLKTEDFAWLARYKSFTVRAIIPPKVIKL